MKSNERVSIIIPTWNNAGYLNPCLLSLIDARGADSMMHIYVVNNGHPNSCDWIDPKHKFITVLQTGGKNLGWEGGLQLGLKHTDAEFVMFHNDDTVVTYAQKRWLPMLLQHFRDPSVAAVGPSSNMVMGFQNMLARTPAAVFTTQFLIGFCMLLRRSALDEVGGVDESLPGGDDLDLSIRLRDKGYKLLVDKNVFVFHYGSTTGNRIHGTFQQQMGWNSPAFTERTNTALIKKHGLKKWWECIKGAGELPSIAYGFKKDSEGDLIREKVDAKGTIIEIGCGNLKTFPKSIGLDIVAKGDIIPQIGGEEGSQADITCDVSAPLPIDNESVDFAIARHILEHMIDPISAVRNWMLPLKKGGKLVISIPNEQLIDSIPMNPEHVHAWTPDTFAVFIETLGGLKIVDMWDSENQISFTTVLEKL